MKWAALFCVLAGGAFASPQQEAQQAMAAIAAAEQALIDATQRDDRVDALTQTVRAFEDGLGAVRAGLRDVTVEQEVVSRRLTAQQAEVARLLAALYAIERAPAPVLMLHPDGPEGAVRSGILLADLTPALQRRVTQLSDQLKTLSQLRQVQAQAEATLTRGLNAAASARAALSQAMANRTDLPLRFVEDPDAIKALLDGSQTLSAFAEGLMSLDGDAAPSTQAAEDLLGRLSPPVQGRILRRYQQADAAGIARPGVIIAAQPSALVTAPATATVRYAGPLLDYGNVIVLEPATGLILVIAGLDALYVSAGEIVSKDAALGILGANSQGLEQSAGGNSRSETVYLEARAFGKTEDPTHWYVLERE